MFSDLDGSIHFAKGHFLGARRDLSCRLMRAVSQSFTKEGKFHKGDEGGYHRFDGGFFLFFFWQVSLVFLIHFAKGHFLRARRDLSCRLMRAVSQSFAKEGSFTKGMREGITEFHGGC